MFSPKRGAIGIDAVGTITASAPGYKPTSKRVLYREGYTTVLDFELERER